jgi:ABC-type multidrug transport system fused ATPase/permease subunit
MVAHRVSTLEGCDSIILLERGAIVASGSHDDLLERSDAFRRLAARTQGIDSHD